MEDVLSPMALFVAVVSMFLVVWTQRRNEKVALFELRARAHDRIMEYNAHAHSLAIRLRSVPQSNEREIRGLSDSVALTDLALTAEFALLFAGDLVIPKYLEGLFGGNGLANKLTIELTKRKEHLSDLNGAQLAELDKRIVGIIEKIKPDASTALARIRDEYLTLSTPEEEMEKFVVNVKGKLIAMWSRTKEYCSKRKPIFALAIFFGMIVVFTSQVDVSSPYGQFSYEVSNDFVEVLMNLLGR